MRLSRSSYRQHYHFSPAPSIAERRWRCFASALFLLLVGLWPEPQLWPLQALQWIIIALLLHHLYRQRRLQPCRAFSLADDGQGRWADDGSQFMVTHHSRLLPNLVMLRIEQQEARVWLWQHRDSYDRVYWHRLCRLVLKVQRSA